MNMDEMLFRHYLEMKGPVGIGTGDWDDFLGYWLNGKGELTSIDIEGKTCGRGAPARGNEDV